MAKKREDPKPNGPKDVAIVELSHGFRCALGWFYMPRNGSYNPSRRFRERDDAIRAALAAGFAAVMVDGKIVARAQRA